MSKSIRRQGDPAARTWCESLERRRLLASSYLAVAGGINDVVYDSSRNVVYATTSAGTIQRYDVASGALLSAWNVGGNLLGADITSDNAFLYVADGSNPQIRKVNLANGTSTALTYAPAFGESNAYDVKIVGTRAIFTTQYSGSGWTPLRNIDLATGAMTTRTDLGSVRQDSGLSRAADGSGLFLTESNISSGPIHYYTTATNLFTGSGGTQSFLGGVLHDVSRDGSLVGMRFGTGVSLFNKSLAGVGTVPSIDGGLRFDPARDMLYGVNSTTDQLVGYDTNAKSQRFAVPLGRNLGSGTKYGSGMMALGASKAFISDDAGLLVVDVPQPTGQAASVQVSGYYSYAKKGVAGTLHVRVLDPAGMPAVNYRGTVRFSSSDAAAGLPSNYTFTANDNGAVDLPVTLNTVGTHTITVTDTATSTLTSQLTGRVVHAGNTSLVPVTDRREHVFDPERNRLYISTSRGVIERFDLATETLLEPLAVGVSLYGIDISSDNRWLMTQEGTSSGTGGEYIKVDLDLIDSGGLSSNYVSRIAYTNYSLERGGWDIARTVRGTFAADGQFAGSGWVPVRDINPVTNAATTIAGFNNVRQNTGIGRSPDGRYLIYTESNISSGPITIVDTQTNQTVSSVSTSTFLSGESSAVNRDGTLFGVRLSGTRIYNRSLQVVTTLTAIDGGMAFDPVSDVLYGVNSSTDQLNVYRTSDWSIVNTIALGENVSSSGAMGSGVTSVAVDGGAVFVSTPAGVRVLRLATRALPGTYTVAEGAPLTLSGSAVAAPGRTITSYEWDFNYDGTFTLDATGQDVNMPTAGLDGPSARPIALRVTDSGGAINIATGSVNIVNTKPAITVGAPATIGVGQTLTLNLSATDPGPDTITDWTINWGEGNVQNHTAGASTTVSRALSVEGVHNIIVTATDEDGTHTASTVQVLVSTAPTVQSITYDFNAVVPAVRVAFSENVGSSIDKFDFEIVEVSLGLGVPISRTAVAFESATNTAVITFPGFANGNIPDGNYRVTAFADGIRDAINNALDGNSNGVGGDDAFGNIFVLRGDANRDRTVNDADYAIFNANFGQSSRTFSHGDFNRDGVVNNADRSILYPQFGKTVLFTKGSISGPVFNDTSGNGRQDGQEAGLWGRTVYLDIDGNSVFDPGEPSRNTNDAGQYLFEALGPGNYAVRQILPSGWMATAPAGAGHGIALSQSQNFSAAGFGSQVIPAWLAPGSEATWNADTDTLTVTGTASIIADPGDDAPAITVNEDASLTLNGGGAVRIGALNLLANAAAAFAPGASGVRTLAVGSLSVAAGATLDIGKHALIVRTGAVADVQSLIAAGYHGGDWLGSGITSSTAAADASNRTALGYVDNAEMGYTEFAGVAGLTGDEILVKYTYYGDADLNGIVDPDDFNQFLAGFQDSSLPRTWVYGDFDYNGQVDPDDFNLFLSLFQYDGGPLN